MILVVEHLLATRSRLIGRGDGYVIMKARVHR
jgi:hypothetical protein